MTEQLHQALAAVRFNSAETPDEVWQTSPSHVDGLHARAEHRIHMGVLDAKKSTGPSPIGLALRGQKGVGKTHLLGGVRQTVQNEGGYFILVDLTTGAAFWDDIARAMRSELWRRNDDGELQLTTLMRRLCDKAEVPDAVAMAILGRAPLTVDDLHGFVSAIRRVDAQVAVECGDTIRALVLYSATDSKQLTIGKDYLTGLPEATAGERQAWSIHPQPKTHRALVTEISRVLSLTGPSVVAVDQLDPLIDKANNAGDDPELANELALIADGLMQLRETTRRTLSIVACLPDTWNLLVSVATASVADRFTKTPILGTVADPRLGQALVEKWLGVNYEAIGFSPPHPTWPVAVSAFKESWSSYTPRQLLRRIQEHAETCLYGEIRELSSFDEEVVEAPHETGPEPGYFAEFDRRFTELRRGADVAAALNQHTEDSIMPDLLQAALRSWINEVGNDDKSWETVPPDGGRQLHAGVRRTLDEERDLAERWMFRAIAPRHGNRVLRLIREARDAAGIRLGVRNRHLVLLHHGKKGWGGTVTRNEVNDLAQVGSPRLEITEEDIRTFFALKEMLTKQSYELLNWLVARKPASRKTFLREILPSPAQSRTNHQTRTNRTQARPDPPPTRPNSTRARTDPAEIRTKPTEFRTKSTEARTKPAEVRTKSTEVRTNPAEVRTNPAEVRTNPTQSRTNPAEVRTNPPQGRTNPAEVRTNPTQARTKPAEVRTDPAEARTKPAEVRTNPAEVRTNPPQARTNPTQGRTNPTQARTNHQETRPPPSGEIVLGMDDEIRVELASLRKHAVIFAGSGAGKTVLLRRIIEECALHGVSSIVLDPNNDLARLGDAWPEPPEGWRPADTGPAAEYLANTEVVVWTPGRAGGRPLSFHPLPDFAAVRADEDEFTAAVGAAVAALVPHARVGGGAKTAVRGRAVLREALTHYARREARSLSGFVDMLAELPDGVSKLSTATKMAADLAETLRAAMVNDPLLGGAGEPADPAALLTPTPGKRARISVVSFIGLPSEEQRQGFVSQLQLEVFAWLKRNPEVDRPLGGLFVMDEAQTIAPSGGWTASTQSTILLASQARKYGLGLLLATQAPKGLHNQVTGNATTQFFGRLNSPAQIAAANEMARAKGSTVADISRLERGQFYVTGDTFGFRRMRAPLCLSHHPPGPLRLEEVLDRARDGR